MFVFKVRIVEQQIIPIWFSLIPQTFCLHNVWCLRHQLVFFMSAAVFFPLRAALYIFDCHRIKVQQRQRVVVARSSTDRINSTRWCSKFFSSSALIISSSTPHLRKSDLVVISLCMAECCKSRQQVRENIILSVKGSAHHSQHKQEGRIFVR